MGGGIGFDGGVFKKNHSLGGHPLPCSPPTMGNPAVCTTGSVWCLLIILKPILIIE